MQPPRLTHPCQPGTNQPRPGLSEPVGRSRFNPLAPDASQEDLRARAGFPWCDTCLAPAVWSEAFGNVHAVLAEHGTLTTTSLVHTLDHPVTIEEWTQSPSW